MVGILEMQGKIESAEKRANESLNKMFNNLQGSPERLVQTSDGLVYRHSIVDRDRNLLTLTLYMPKVTTGRLPKHFFSSDPVSKIGRGRVRVNLSKSDEILSADNMEVEKPYPIEDINFYPEKGELRFFMYFDMKGDDFKPFAEQGYEGIPENRLELLLRTTKAMDEYNAMVELQQNNPTA